MEQAYDVVVLGSGAAGLTAALAAAVRGASVAVFEKADRLGGTSALSGAGIWIPGNQLAGQAGIEDSRERGLEYLMSLSNGMILPELAEALIDGIRTGGGAVLVRGAPGIGKSALIAEARALAQEAGLQVLGARGRARVDDVDE